jgi:site-specific DNA recombinase
MIAGIYTRISTGEQSKYSLDSQETEIREYCEKNNMIISKIYSDKKSGLEFENREGLQELLDDGEKKKFEVLLITEWDRLSRDPELTGYIKLTLRPNGVDIIAINEQKHNNEYDELVEGMMALISKFETQRRLRRVKRGIKKARENKVFMNRPAFAYYIDKINGISPDNKKKEIVINIFNSFLKGNNQTELSKRHNIPRTTIGYILRNNFYCDNNKNGKHKAIITKELFQQVQTKFKG